MKKILESWDIDTELQIRHLESFGPGINDLARKYFDDTYPILRWKNFLSPEEEIAISELDSRLKNKQRIDIGIFKDDEIIGWSYGWQGGMESATYYMANSLVIPAYRGRGLYKLMLEKIIKISKELNFQTITSRHVAANNPVIIPKLKAGFKITGMELSEIHGNLVHLTYFHNELRAENYDIRCGLKKAK